MLRKLNCHPTPHPELGSSNQQALMLLVLALPLGLIAIGGVFIFLNTLQRPATEEESKPILGGSGNSEKAKDEGSISEEKTQQTVLDSPSEIRAEEYKSEVIELGNASTGAPLRLLMDSIVPVGGDQYTFSYQLGNTAIRARANCPQSTWTSYPENQINRPQSEATLKMLRIICLNSTRTIDGSPSPQSSYPGTAIVFDPPSNVRQTPGGDFLCTIETKTTIRVGNPSGSWYPTSACGRPGFIHNSQIRF